MSRTGKSRLRAGSIVGLVVLALLVAACGSSSSKSKVSSAVSSAASSVSSAASSAASPATAVTISTAKGSGGVYLTGASGRALYLWMADTSGKSSCAGACAKVWPPVVATATPVASGGVKASDLALITRTNGSQQVTYNGHPLYYFVGDTKAGTDRGQGTNGFGAKWWLVAPSGSAIVTHAAAASGGSSSSSSGSGGGWG
jgi:predicted lipoprotein with Yx(FWY)xxD motif